MKIPNPPLKVCAEIIEFVYEFNFRNKKIAVDKIREHFNITPAYFERAFSYLSEHEIILDDSFGEVSLSNNATDLMKKSAKNSWKIVLEGLMGIQPFIEFTYFLGKGKSEIESIKLVCSLYDIKQDHGSLLKIFKNWIKILGLNVSDVPASNKTIDGLKESLQNSLYANNFVKEYLGENLKDTSEGVAKNLANSIKSIPQDNELAVNEAGRALEDFLRLDLASELDLTRCSGIGEIANELNRSAKYPKKLNSLCLGLASIRSMGKAHGADKHLNIQWSVTEQGAIGYVITVLNAINSYLTYRNTGILIY